MYGKSVAVHIRLYAFPLLPFVMGEQLGVSVRQAGSMFLVFAVAMFAVGLSMPIWSMNIKETRAPLLRTHYAGGCSGYALDGYTKFLLLAAVQEHVSGWQPAGITVAIDITTSRRSAGNIVYAWAARQQACWWVLCWYWNV